MKYERNRSGKIPKKQIRGSAEILVRMSSADTVDSILARIETILAVFYKKTVGWKRDNPHTEIHVYPVTRMYPMMLSDMPICSEPTTSFIVSSRTDRFAPVSIQDWKKNFEATVMALAESFGQATLYVEYTDINVAVFEAVTEGDE